MAIKSRLPGISFQTEPPALEEKLPRMDIAAFVGFASSGPLNIPVPVEDMARFRDIFGDDLALAWDTSTQKMQYAYLAPAVEAFFHNGGRRCWVVRVAGDTARSNRFLLPGLVVCADDNTFPPALACARCEGSWSDTLRVNTVLQSQAIKAADFKISKDNKFKYIVDITARNEINRGDLLRLNFDDNEVSLFLIVEALEASSHKGGNPVQRARGNKGYWSKLASPKNNDDLLPASDVQELINKCQENGSCPEISTAYRLSFDLWVWRGEEILSRMNDLAFNDLHPRFWENLPSDSKLFNLPDGKSVQPSCEMKVSSPRFPLSGPEEKGTTYLPLGMPSKPDPTTSQGPFDPIKENTVLLRNGLESFNAMLFLDQKLANISTKSLLNEANSIYYLKNIKDDAPLHGLHSLLPVDEVTLVAIPDAVHCGWEYAGSSNTELLLAPTFQKLEPSEKDGITISWSEVNGAEAYILQEGIDPDFTQSLTSIKTSNTKKYINDKKNCSLFYYYRVCASRAGKVSPWSNTISIAFPLSEFEKCIPELLSAPNLELKIDDHYYFDWESVKEATDYILQESTDPAFDTASTIYKGKSQKFPIQCRNKGIYYYRIKAQRNSESGPWSETLVSFFSIIEFKTKFIKKIIELRSVIDRNDIKEARKDFSLILLNMMEFLEDNIGDVWRAILSDCWSSQENNRRALFEKLKNTEFDTKIHYSWDNALKDIWEKRNDGSTPVDNLTPEQIKTSIDNLGDIDSNLESSFLNIVKNALDPLEHAKWTIVKPENNDTIFKVQKALLNFCAARGDIMAVLTLPRHYGEEEALAHVASLVSGMEEKHVLSFGAIYHPWIYTRSESSSAMRLIPPDGAVCGNMASGAISKGAWIAPANVLVKNAISLNPVIDNGSRDRLFTAQVNLIRQEPRGFIISGAYTLCPETELQPINVRRLLILLRRLALREGTAYIFQPNDENFRSLIRHKYEQLLSDLYIRGAFTGDRPEAAYRIITDNSINTQKSLDLGRFIIELWISPSRPMTFITLRLVQTSQEMFEIQEM